MTANRIKEIRTRCKLTQQQLGERVGLSQSHIAMLEKGERSLDIELMGSISKELNVKPYELLPQEWQPEEISPEEREILRMIRKTAPTQKADNCDLSAQTDNTQNTRQQVQPPHQTSSNER